MREALTSQEIKQSLYELQTGLTTLFEAGATNIDRKKVDELVTVTALLDILEEYSPTATVGLSEEVVQGAGEILSEQGDEISAEDVFWEAVDSRETEIQSQGVEAYLTQFNLPERVRELMALVTGKRAEAEKILN